MLIIRGNQEKNGLSMMLERFKFGDWDPRGEEGPAEILIEKRRMVAEHGQESKIRDNEIGVNPGGGQIKPIARMYHHTVLSKFSSF